LGEQSLSGITVKTGTMVPPEIKEPDLSSDQKCCGLGEGGRSCRGSGYDNYSLEI
jgi:hypothetical protein